MKWFRRGTAAPSATEQLQAHWAGMDAEEAQGACGEPGCCEAGACTAQVLTTAQEAVQLVFRALQHTIIVSTSQTKALIEQEWEEILTNHDIKVVTPAEARAMNMSLFLKYGSELPEEAVQA